ncbi:unnamed protein product [Cochlearia groenlandica]
MKMESRDPYVREEFSEPESEEDLSQIHETEEVSKESVLDLNRDLLLSQDLTRDSNCDVPLSKDLTGDSNRDLLLSKDLNGRHPMQTRDVKVLTEMESYSVSAPIETKSTIQEVSFSVMEPCLRSRNASLVVEAAFIVPIKSNILSHSQSNMLMDEANSDAHQVFDEMSLKGYKLQQKKMKSLFPKTWMFKFKVAEEELMVEGNSWKDINIFQEKIQVEIDRRVCVGVHDMILRRSVQKRTDTFFSMGEDWLMKFGFKIAWCGYGLILETNKKLSQFSAQRGHTSGTEFRLWHRWRYKYEFTHKTWQKSKNDTMKHSESFLIDIYNHYGSVKGTKTDMLKSTIQSAMAKSSWRVYIWKTKKILRLGSD